MTAPSPLVELVDVDVRFQGRAILEDITLKVEPGELISVIGPNGAGKTTLLRVALGLLPPDRGRARMRPGLRIGYMPQRLQLDPTFPLTVHRFLRLAGHFSRERLWAALAETGAEHLLASPLHSLSGGETQRVLLARAILRQPDLLVLDEPAQGVDVHGQVEFFQRIGRLRQEQGCAILMVSHDLHLVMAATDRVICLNRHICCTGPPEAVSRSPEFLELFGPRALEILALYSHDRNHRHED